MSTHTIKSLVGRKIISSTSNDIYYVVQVDDDKLQAIMSISERYGASRRLWSKPLTLGEFSERLANGYFKLLPVDHPSSESPSNVSTLTRGQSMLYVVTSGDSTITGENLLALHDKMAERQKTDRPSYSVTTYEDRSDYALSQIPEPFHQVAESLAAGITQSENESERFAVLQRVIWELQPAIKEYTQQIRDTLM